MGDATLVGLSNLGYQVDVTGDEAYKYFDKAWDYVLDNLVKSCQQLYIKNEIRCYSSLIFIITL